MPVQILHVRLTDAAGHVVAHKRAPFIVCGEDEDRGHLLAELERIILELEKLLQREG